MQLIRHLPLQSDSPTAVAIGNFDGLHLGHQAVIAAMQQTAQARGLIPSVLTFEPHPRRLFAPHAAAFRLEQLAVKLARLRAAGIERVYIPRFDAAFASLSAEAFMTDVLGHALGAKVVVTGENFAFGKGRSGDIATLRTWGAAHGVESLTVAPVERKATICSSSAVRTALAAGAMEEAALLLGRPYGIAGRVIHGDGRGRGIGFPTVNIALVPRLQYPAYGVYAVRVTRGSESYDGVANLGVRPTIAHTHTPSLEVHLFDFMQDIYGARLTVEFIARVRNEQKFDSLAALTGQIAQDCAHARTILSKTR